MNDKTRVRDMDLRVRINNIEEIQINALCRYYGKSKSDVIRKLIRDEVTNLSLTDINFRL